MRLHSLTCLGPHGLHRLAYREWGDPACPRVLLCVHGLTRTGLDFAPVAEALADGWRVVAPDMPGRGDSDWLPVAEDYAISTYLADCVALIGRLGVKQVDWLGTSMGGIIGMSLASLPGAPIRRLVLNDVGPFIPVQALQRIAAYIGGEPRFNSLEQVAELFKVALASFGPLSDLQWLHMAELATRPADGGGLRLHYDAKIAQAFGKDFAQDVSFWPVWDMIAASTMVIRGGISDILTAETAREMTERGPKAELKVIPGTGHAPMLWNDDHIGWIRDFLERA